MMSRKFTICVLVFSILLASCYRSYPEQFSPVLKMLEGEWAEGQGIGYRETWERTPSKLEGKGFMHAGNSFSQTESIAILFNDSTLTYAAKVENQNSGMIILFNLRSYTDSSLVFVNEKHDFPNVIAYYFINDSLLKIDVESLTDPKSNFSFRLKKTGN